MSTNDCCR